MHHSTCGNIRIFAYGAMLLPFLSHCSLRYKSLGLEVPGKPCYGTSWTKSGELLPVSQITIHQMHCNIDSPGCLESLFSWEKGYTDAKYKSLNAYRLEFVVGNLIFEHWAFLPILTGKEFCWRTLSRNMHEGIDLYIMVFLDMVPQLSRCTSAGEEI
jgi:hypothetical protein